MKLLSRLPQTWFHFLLSAATLGAATTEANWPQWRGPLQNGVAPAGNPPVTWSESNNVAWKVKIPGNGQATPIVWEDRVFVQTAIPTGKKVEPKPGETAEAAAPQPPPGPPPGTNMPPGGGPPGPGRGGGGRRGPGPKPTEYVQFALLCLDRQTGKLLWQEMVREEVPHEGFRQNEGSLASSSGLTDGERVYGYFGSRGVYCYDLAGKAQWNKDLGRMRIAMSFGEGNSPALYKDALIINWDNEEGSFIVALDKKTGKELWRKSRDEGTSWSTPLVVEYGGKAQVVVSATRKIRSYDPGSGDLLWECGGLTRNVIPSPVADATAVYCMSGFQGNAALAIRLGRTGDLAGTDAIAWTHKKSTPYVPSPLLYGDKLYFFAGNNGILTCLNTKTGQPWFDAERLEGLSGVYASPVGASGRVYLAGRNGTCLVLKQSDTLEVMATNRLEEKFDASPAVAGKDLFLRGQQYLYCLRGK